MTGDLMLPALEILIMLRPSNRLTELRLGLRFALERGQRDSKKPDRLLNRHLVLKQGNR
jgi:hypothetical protein